MIQKTGILPPPNTSYTLTMRKSVQKQHSAQTLSPIDNEPNTLSIEVKKELDPRKLGFTEEFVADLYLKIKELVQEASPEAIKLINRCGIDGMSLGALHPKAWYSLALFTNLLRIAIADVYDAGELDPELGFTHCSGEGGIPPVHDIFEDYTNDIRDKNGRVLFTYNANLFTPQIGQYASGQFFTPSEFKTILNIVLELKLGQGAKGGIGGLLPGHKNTQTVSFLRSILEGILVPSPNNIPTIKSVEELITLRIALEQLTGKQVHMKTETAYNVIARALAIARAQGTLNLAGGPGGGTAASKFDIRNNTGHNGWYALRGVREAFNNAGFNNTPIIFSNNFYTHEEIAEGLMQADGIRFGTGILIWLLECIYAKQCHINCPKNITTHQEKFNVNVLLENVINFFSIFEKAAEHVRHLGLSDKCHRKLTQKELAKSLKPKDPNSPLAQWLSYQINSDGSPITQESPSVIIANQRSKKQIESEQQVHYELTEGKKKHTSVPGAAGAIGMFGRFQRNVDLYTNSTIEVATGGTFFGIGNYGLQLYPHEVGDAAGNMQMRGRIVTGSAGRHFGVGAIGGNLYAAHTGSDAFFRAGTVTGVIETAGDSFAHFSGRCHLTVLGKASDFHPFSTDIQSNGDEPIGRKDSIGYNPFAALAGATIVLPKTTWDTLVETQALQEATWDRLQVSELDETDIAKLLENLQEYTTQMSILGKERKIADSLQKAITEKTLDPQEAFIKVGTNPNMVSGPCDTIKKYRMQKTFPTPSFPKMGSSGAQTWLTGLRHANRLPSKRAFHTAVPPFPKPNIYLQFCSRLIATARYIK